MLDTCFTQNASARIALHPVEEDASATEFRIKHDLGHAVGLYATYIVQPVRNSSFVRFKCLD